MDKLVEFLGTSGDDAEFAHLVDFQLEDKLDDEWIPQFVDGGWIVITSDRGTNPSRGSKLPLLCRHYGITHVLLSGAVHNMKTFDKARAIASVWPSIVRLPEWPAGTGHKLQKTAAGAFVIKSPPLPGSDDPEPAQQLPP